MAIVTSPTSGTTKCAPILTPEHVFRVRLMLYTSTYTILAQLQYFIFNRFSSSSTFIPLHLSTDQLRQLRYYDNIFRFIVEMFFNKPKWFTKKLFSFEKGRSNENKMLNPFTCFILIYVVIFICPKYVTGIYIKQHALCV